MHIPQAQLLSSHSEYMLCDGLPRARQTASRRLTLRAAAKYSGKQLLRKSALRGFPQECAFVP